VSAGPAGAVIEKVPALKDVLADAQYIFTVKVDALDADKPSVVFAVAEDLKDKAEFRRLAVNLKGDAEAEKNKHTPQLLKRLAPDLPLVIFVIRREKSYVTFGYTNGTWFQMRGVTDGDAVRWSFLHCEPYLRRTFKGSTAELKQVVVDGLSGKKQPPEPELKEKPGLGPEVQDKETRRQGDKETRERRLRPSPCILVSLSPCLLVSLSEIEPTFSVIPSVLIGGPLAVLAMLFPTVFGGWKRWLALISVACTISSLYFVQWLFGGSLAGTWWGGPSALWVGMALTTLAGMLWAWQRHALRVQSGEAALKPSGVELAVLVLLSLVGIGLAIYCRASGVSLLAPDWLPFVVLCVGAWVATAYAIIVRWSHRTTPSLATEGVMLTAIGFTFVIAGALMQPSAAEMLTAAETGEAQRGADNHVITPGKHVWTFRVSGKGSLASSPLVAGDRLYFGVSRGGFAEYGEVFCLDRATGKPIWTFNNDEEMKAISISSPCLADGRLYIGEGYHQDSNCKLYCINAETGAKLWEFQTGSHTESSPCVADGKVYFGAGDDGLYCVDAATGKEVWHFPGFHMDASPVVSRGRVYIGAGIGDVYKDTALFCLDAANGNVVWRQNCELPAWPAAAVLGPHVYFGLGNGRMDHSDDRPAGALLCLEAETGNEVWRYPVNDGILGAPVADGRYVCFGSRDGYLYCVERSEGKLAWRQSLGGPCVTAPVVARCSSCGARTSVFTVASDGRGLARLFCLGANTGRNYWTLDLAALEQAPMDLFATPVLSAAPEARRIYVGGTANATVRSAVLYCLEDHIETQATH
jgi:outer membrane protein assembly factor BamB